jgi:hypothetical protein
MDNTNNVSKSIFNSDSEMFGSPVTSSSSGTGIGTGIWEGIKSISWVTWMIIILILAFLGFNVFAYLAQGTQEAAGIFGPLVAGITNIIRVITGQTLNVSAEGGKAVVNTVANVATTGLNDVQQIGQEILPNQASTSLTNGQVSTSKQSTTDNNALSRAINSAQSRNQNGLNDMDYEADEATSSIQGGGKSGWCYIGEDRGFRSCASVGPNDTCMSGDIFPTHEICINPNLRP